MEKKVFNTATRLQAQIDQLKADIKLLKEQIESKNPLIRFGGHFNVSAPIEVDKIVIDTFCEYVIEDKMKTLALKQKEFDTL